MVCKDHKFQINFKSDINCIKYLLLNNPIKILIEKKLGRCKSGCALNHSKLKINLFSWKTIRSDPEVLTVLTRNTY